MAHVIVQEETEWDFLPRFQPLHTIQRCDLLPIQNPIITAATSNSSSMIKPILVRHCPSARGSRRSRHHVHFVHLNLKDEEERSLRGQAMRKHQKARMLYDRKVRWQEHMDRKRAFDVFSSTNVKIRKQVEDLLEEDSRSTDKQYYSRCLYAMLYGLGGPPLHLNAALEWFRHSGIQYSKQLCLDYELSAVYLLFLGRADIFQKRFREAPACDNTQRNNNDPNDWTNPFLTSTPSTTVSSPGQSGYKVLSPMRTSSNGKSNTENDAATNESHRSIPTGSKPCQQSYHKRNPKRLLQRALTFLWRKLARRGRHGERRRHGGSARSSRVVVVDAGGVITTSSSHDVISTYPQHDPISYSSNATVNTQWWAENPPDDPWDAGWITGGPSNTSPLLTFPRVF